MRRKINTPQKRRTKKIVTLDTFAIFDRNAGHRVTKIYPVYRIIITYISYFIYVSLTRKKNFYFTVYTPLRGL